MWRTERHMQERRQAQCVRPLGKLEVVVVVCEGPGGNAGHGGQRQDGLG